MTSREQILDRLRLALARSDLRYPPPDPAPLTGATRMAVTAAGGDSAALAARFGQELETVYGTWEVATGTAAAATAVIERLRGWIAAEQPALPAAAAPEILTWAPAALPVPGLPGMLRAAGFSLVTAEELEGVGGRARAASVRFGVTGVEAAFASTGTLLMVAGAGRSRSASLLPLHHIALIPLSRLYRTVEHWLSEGRESGSLEEHVRRSANLSLITGPSKSADIEGNLTLGVHGPQFVHAILFQD